MFLHPRSISIGGIGRRARTQSGDSKPGPSQTTQSQDPVGRLEARTLSDDSEPGPVSQCPVLEEVQEPHNLTVSSSEAVDTEAMAPVVTGKEYSARTLGM
eukprot:g45783.t1